MSEIERRVIDGRAVCDECEAECRCRKDAGHDGPHVCPCGGSWEWIDGHFEVVEFPPFAFRPDLPVGGDW